MYDIETIKRKLLVKYPFFGSVIANVNYKENMDIPTAGTEGKTIFYNPEFLAELDFSEQLFIFAHEICHIAFNHIIRSEGKDLELWTVATDGVINQYLKRDGLKMPSTGIDIKEAINYDAEELYKKLLQEKQQKQNNRENSHEQQANQNNQQDLQSSGDISNSKQQEAKGSSDIGHATHQLWEEAVKKNKEEQSQLNKKDSPEKIPSEIDKKQKEIEKIGEKNTFNINCEDKKKQLEKLKQELAKQISTSGTSTNSNIREIEDVGSASSLIDWRYILREAIKYNVDWSYKNATIEDGVIVAHLEEQMMPETEILLDTSGSIDKALLKNFLRECKNILYYSKLKVGCFDTNFYGFHEIRTEEDIENMIFEGGGGTDFDIAVKAFSRRVENKIIFTDGCADMPQMSIDAIWIVFGNKIINPKGGRVISITDEQLDKLQTYSLLGEFEGRTK